MEPGPRPDLGCRILEVHLCSEASGAARRLMVGRVSRQQRPGRRPRLSRFDKRGAPAVKTLLADNASVSVGATHEICEMAVDPQINGAFQNAQGVFWASEICDPVESDQYGYEINGILVTDFVTPAWYAFEHAQGAVDFKNHARRPFQVLSGG